MYSESKFKSKGLVFALAALVATLLNASPASAQENQADRAIAAFDRAIETYENLSEPPAPQTVNSQDLRPSISDSVSAYEAGGSVNVRLNVQANPDPAELPPGLTSVIVRAKPRGSDRSVRSSRTGTRPIEAFGPTVVETGETSVRIAEVVESADDIHEFRYKIITRGVRDDDVKLELLGDSGAVSISTTLNDTTYHLGAVSPPWAYDSLGNSVQAHFEIGRSGKLLRLILEPDPGAAYPIVVDPEVHTSWWGQTLKLNRHETDTLIQVLREGANGASAIATICGTITAGTCAAILGSAAFISFATSWVISYCSNEEGVDIHVP